jgi:glycosyltransferase involved in cell wall biosynthesis
VLDLVIPVYNEEQRLEKSVEHLSRFLEQNSLHDITVVLADNGSTDRTPQLIRSLTAKHKNFRGHFVPQPGVGRALHSAWKSSAAPFVGSMDLDLSTDLKHLAEARNWMGTAGPHSLLNGSRLLGGSKVYDRKWIRELSSRVFNFILRQVLAVRFTDAMCGFTFLPRSLFEEITAEHELSHRWFFSAELLIKAEWLGVNITEIPVIWRDDPRSKVKLLQLTKEYLSEIARVVAEKKQKFRNRSHA